MGMGVVRTILAKCWMRICENEKVVFLCFTVSWDLVKREIIEFFSLMNPITLDLFVGNSYFSLL